MNASAKKKLILLTGCSGLVGTRLRAALGVDFQIIGLDNSAPEQEGEGSVWIKCDLSNETSVHAALKEVRQNFGPHFVSVIHLAGYYDFAGEPSLLYEKQTGGGTHRLLQALQTFRVEQFIVLSSLLSDPPAAPGNLQASGLLAEGDYSRAQWVQANQWRQARGKIPLVILRLGGVYDERCHSLPLAQQIRRIYEKKFESCLFPGDKTHGRAVVHLADVASGLQHVIAWRQELKAEELFLIAESEVLSYMELQERFGHLLYGPAWPSLQRPPLVARMGALMPANRHGTIPFIKPWMIDVTNPRYPEKIRRTNENLNWWPRHRLTLTLAAMTETLRQSPTQWYKDNGLPAPLEWGIRTEEAQPVNRTCRTRGTGRKERVTKTEKRLARSGEQAAPALKPSHPINHRTYQMVAQNDD